MADAYSQKVRSYYHTFESIVGYRLMTKGVKHFGYHPDPEHPVSLEAAQLAEDDLIAKALKLPSGAQVLEAGCGEGSAANYIATKYGYNITGVDLLPRNIQRAKALARQKQTSAQFMVGDYMQLPFDNETFEGVYAMETLVHAPEAIALFNELLRMLKPGGKLVFCEYSMTPRARLSEAGRTVMTMMNTHSHMPSLEQFTTGAFPALLTTAGFSNVAVTDITDNFMPSLRYFHHWAHRPNQLIKKLGLQKRFINAYSAAEIYNLHLHGEDLIQYSLVEAIKPS